jgi:hypothetical protein
MSVSESRATVPTEHSRLQEFVDDVFRSLRRAEQRRWAGIYLSGLGRGEGRKTPRGLARAERLPPAAAAGLHQFINGSPWEWAPVRRGLALRIATSTVPYAWTVAEMIVPKRGEHSVGVHRHRDAGSGRTVNCQRSLGFFLVTDAGTFPVDWSLMLRDGWESDSGRRHRARIPAAESGRPIGTHVADYADQVAAAGLPAVPWVLDLTRCEDAAGVIAGLARRRLAFACEIGPGQPVVAGSPAAVTAGELMETRRGQRSEPPARPAGDRGGGAPTYGASVRLPLPGPSTTGGSRTVRVLELPDPDRHRPSRYWITSCMTGRVGDVLPVVRAGNAALRTVAELQAHFGVRDFEGRSFPGWHRHMTMASAAFACRSLMGGDARPDLTPVIRDAGRDLLLTGDPRR